MVSLPAEDAADVRMCVSAAVSSSSLCLSSALGVLKCLFK